MTVFDLVLQDLESKPLFLVGGRDSGKTTLAKRIIELSRRRFKGSDIRVYDCSTAWWWSSPLQFKQLVSPGRGRTQSDTLYEVGKLSRDERRDFLIHAFKTEYLKRYNQSLLDPDFKGKTHLSLMCLEEAQSLLRKYGELPTEIHDWVSIGRNLRMTGLLCTQRPAEIKTEIIERCNLLVGYIEGDRNKMKVRGATDKDFVKKLRTLGRYEFGYYNGGKFRKVKVNQPKNYKSPLLISSKLKVRETTHII